VIDIQPIRPEIIGHQIYRKRYGCGHVTHSDYPATG
jgi:hypothetical protein